VGTCRYVDMYIDQLEGASGKGRILYNRERRVNGVNETRGSEQWMGGERYQILAERREALLAWSREEEDEVLLTGSGTKFPL
jgi:hypothetical protein